ncbi:MAG TPA: hypothetical protein VGD84_10280, partial [Pseudonocardiaceae bacterium]
MAEPLTDLPAGRRPALVAAIVATLLLLGTAALIVLRVLAPSDGSVIDSGDNALPAGQVVVQGVTSDSGLRVGDRVLAIGDRQLASVTVPGAAPAGRPGDVVDYQVVRDGRTITVPVRLSTFPFPRQLADNWPTLLVEFALIVVSGFLFLRRPGQPAVHAAVIATACAVFTGAGSGYPHLEAYDLVAGTQFGRWSAGEIAYALLWAMILHFAIVFPTAPGRPHLRRWLALGYAGPLVLHGCLVGYAFVAGRTGLA